MSYQPGIPTGKVPLNQDFLNIKGNFTALNDSFLVDHEPLTTATNPPNGYHKAIHLVPQAPPLAVSGYGELYAQTLNDGSAVGQQLWYQFINGSSATINYPLTRNIQPAVSANGYTFLPGGLLMAWGTSTAGATVNYGVTFANVFAINITVKSLTANATDDVNTPPQAINVGLSTFKSGNHSGDGYTFYWTAIGN